MPKSVSRKNINRIPEALTDGNVILLGAACTGKSPFLKELIDLPCVDTLDQLSDYTDSPEIILDEFYTIFSTANARPDDEATIDLWDVLERDSGICLAMRPWSFEWLLAETEFKDRFDIEPCTIYFLGHSRKACFDECRRLYPDVTVPEINRYADDLRTTYEFNCDYLAGETYSTLVPAAFETVRHLDTGDDDEGRITELRSRARGAVKKVLSLDISVDTRNVITQSLGGMGALMGLSGDPVMTAAAAIVVVAHHGLAITGDDGTAIDSGDSIDSLVSVSDSIEPLLSDYLLPYETAELEAELGMPPRTVDNLRTLFTENGLEQLTDLLNNFNPNQIATIEADVQANSERLNAVEDTAELLQNRIEGATQPLTTLADALEANEARLLAPAEGASVLNVDLSDLDYYRNTTDPTDDPIEAAELAATLEASDRPEIVVLRGPHGTGKTRFAHRLGTELVAREYEVVRPNPLDRAYLPYALRRTDRPTALITSFVGGDYAISDETELRQLFTLLRDGYYETIIIECRSERGELLESTAGEAIQVNETGTRTVLYQHWEARRTILFNQLDTNREIEPIARNALERLGLDPEAIDDVLNDVVSVASGNPEIAKIAAGIASRNPTAVEGLSSEDRVVAAAIEPLFSNDRTATAFRYLATVRKMETPTLKQIMRLSGDELASLREQLFGYLTIDPLDNGEGELWRITPEIYGQVAFRRKCLPPTTTQGRHRIDEYVSEFVDSGHTELLFRVAESLRFEYAVADGDLRRQCVERADTLVTKATADPSVFVHVLMSLGRGTVPIDPTVLRNHPESLLAGGREVWEGSSLSPTAFFRVMGRSVGRTALEQATTGGELTDTLGDLMEVLVTVFETAPDDLDVDHGTVVGEFCGLALTRRIALERPREQRLVSDSAADADRGSVSAEFGRDKGSLGGEDPESGIMNPVLDAAWTTTDAVGGDPEWGLAWTTAVGIAEVAETHDTEALTECVRIVGTAIRAVMPATDREQVAALKRAIAWTAVQCTASQSESKIDSTLAGLVQAAAAIADEIDSDRDDFVVDTFESAAAKAIMQWSLSAGADRVGTLTSERVVSEIASVIDKPAATVQQNLLGGMLGHLTYHDTPEGYDLWLAAIGEFVANWANHWRIPGQFAMNVYANALEFTGSFGSGCDRAAWVAPIRATAERTAIELDVDLPHFLAHVYAMAIGNLVCNTDDDDDWIEILLDDAHGVAGRSELDADLFLGGELYPQCIAQCAATSPRTVNVDWLERFFEEGRNAVLADEVSTEEGPQPEDEDPFEEIDWQRDIEPAVEYGVAILTQLASQGSPDVVESWYSAVTDRLDTLAATVLPEEGDGTLIGPMYNFYNPLYGRALHRLIKIDPEERRIDWIRTYLDHVETEANATGAPVSSVLIDVFATAVCYTALHTADDDQPRPGELTYDEGREWITMLTEAAARVADERGFDERKFLENIHQSALNDCKRMVSNSQAWA